MKNTKQHKLYGNGIDDDYPALQELLDSTLREIRLPEPEHCYMISKPLKFNSNKSLILGKFTLIRLMPNANCSMLENADFAEHCGNLSIEGGIWDMNHNAQWPNPWHFPDSEGLTSYDKLKAKGYEMPKAENLPDVYTGFAMRFCRTKNLTIKNLTIKNPVTYGIQVARTEDFIVENIYFDYTEGSPKLWNMDGVHVEGYCKNGMLKNLHGTCHDDFVAITADDSLYGPVENIVVDGIFAENTHSAVRLLSHGIPVKNIHISNVYGSFYTYCIGLTKYHGGPEETGVFENISIDNIYASSCAGTKDVEGGNFPFIWVQGGLAVRNLYITNVSRDEKTYPVPMIKIDKNAAIGELHLKSIRQKSCLDKKIPLLVIEGEVKELIENGIHNE